MAEQSGAGASMGSVAMSKVNFAGVISSGLVAGAISALLKALVEEPLFDRPFFTALESAGSPVRHELPATFLVLAIGATFMVGVYGMWLYASIRPRYGPGAKTAILAGFAVWFLIAITDSVWISFQLMPVKSMLAPVFCALPEIVIGLLIGARFYRE